MSTSETEATEETYQTAKAFAIESTIEFLRLGERLGKEQHLMAAEFMAAFQQAASEVLGD